MANGLIVPPTMHELLTDPPMRKVILTAPKLPSHTELPFRVWGIRHDDKWAGKLFPDYREAFALVKKMLGQPEMYRDVVITCRPVGFAKPEPVLIDAMYDWCGHCRRPTVYRRMVSHAAMKKWPVISDEDVRRCYYCAARESTWTRR